MHKSFSLALLAIGEKAVISTASSNEIPSKFLEMGLLPGSLVEIKHKAPFNGPIGIHIHRSNTLIAIRTTEACQIFVEK